MSCKQCQDLIGLPREWEPHSQLAAAGSAGTRGYQASAHQKLYACKTCNSVLLYGRNTGWKLAVKAG